MSELRGFKELSKKLQTMQSQVERKITRRGAAKFAQVVRKEMRKNAPSKSGKLKKNIKYKIQKINSGGFTAHIGAFDKGYYAMFNEFGTKKHSLTTKKKRFISINGNVRSDVNHPGQKAKPFIKKSFDESKKRALKEAGEIMFKLMVKV